MTNIFEAERAGAQAYDDGKSPFESGHTLDSTYDRAWRRGWTVRMNALERSKSDAL